MNDQIAALLFGSGEFVRFVPIQKQEILDGSLKTVEAMIEVSLQDISVFGTINPWNMTISGYDSDPRSLPMIPEVVAWFKKVQEAYPYFPIFLSAFSVHSYLLSQVDFQVIGSGPRAGMTEKEQEDLRELMEMVEGFEPDMVDAYRPQFAEDVVYSMNSVAFEALVNGIQLMAGMFLTSKGVNKDDQEFIIQAAMSRVNEAFSL